MKDRAERRQQRRADGLFLGALTVVGLLVSAHLVLVVPPAALEQSAGGSTQPGAGGEIRDVDEQRIRRMILEGRLSDHEAMHYRKLKPKKTKK